MEELLKTIIENLVDEKDSVSISKEEAEGGIVTFKVKVAKPEMGKAP